MSRGERGAISATVAASVATALAVLAVLAVLASATVAGVVYRDGPDPIAGATTQSTPGTSDSPDPEPPEDRHFPDGQLLTGDRRDNATVDVPAPRTGWDDTDLTLGYEPEDSTLGEGTVGVQDAFVLDRGYCTQDSGFEDFRAYLGFTAPIAVEPDQDDPARSAAEATVERWLPVIISDPADYPEVDYAEVDLADGSSGVVATLVFPVTVGRNRCSPPATELRFLALETGSYSAVAVLNRDVERDGGDRRGGLSADDATEILGTARKVPDQ